MNEIETIKHKLRYNVVSYVKRSLYMTAHKKVEFDFRENSEGLFSWCLWINSKQYFGFTFDDETQRAVKKYLSIYKASISYLDN